MDEECRTLFCDIDLGELRMRALYDAKCLVWKSEHLHDHVEKETDCSFKCSFTSERGTRCQFNSTTRRGTDQPHGESTWFLQSCAASCDYKRMPLVTVNFLYTTGMLNITRVRSSCYGFCRAGGSHVQTEVKQPLLLVVCPLCKIDEIANQESESSSLPHAESVPFAVFICVPLL